MSHLIPLNFHKIMQSKGYTVFVLGSEEKKFAIYTQAHVGESIQSLMNGNKKSRPMTYEFISNLLQGLDVKPLQVIIHNIKDTIYYAKLILERIENDKKTLIDIDTRPSDCLTLALLSDIPIFCTKSALEKAVALEE